MKRWILAVAALMLFSVAAKAQDVSKAEVFAGYSYVHVSDNGATANLNGGNAAASYNLTDTLGIVADFGGYHAGDSLGGANVYTYMFGPKVQYHAGRVAPFVQALFGGAHATVGGFGAGSENAFSMALGGGVDWNATQHIGVRLIQAEYLLTTFNDLINNRQNNARISAGVVFHF